MQVEGSWRYGGGTAAGGEMGLGAGLAVLAFGCSCGAISRSTRLSCPLAAKVEGKNMTRRRHSAKKAIFK